MIISQTRGLSSITNNSLDQTYVQTFPISLLLFTWSEDHNLLFSPFFQRSCSALLLRSKMPRRGKIVIDWQNNKLAPRETHFFVNLFGIPALHDNDVKLPNFTFYWKRKQTTTNFSFSFWTWIFFLRSTQIQPNLRSGSIFVSLWKLHSGGGQSGSR